MQVFADQLSKDRTSGGVLVDRLENVFFRTRLGVNAKEFGEKIIRCAVVRDDAHERQIRYVLHRGERGERPARLLARRQTRGERLASEVSHAGRTLPNRELR